MSSLVKVVKFRKNTSPIHRKDAPLNEEIQTNIQIIPEEDTNELNNKKNFPNLIIFNLDNSDEDSQSEVDLPDSIHITYKNDINIIRIHEVIRRRFSYEKHMLNNYNDQIKKINIDIKYAVSMNESRRMIKQKSELQGKIKDIISSESWTKYVDRVKNLLIAYTQVSTDKSKGIIIVGKRSETYEDKRKTELRLDIIDLYINIASEYITLNVSRIEKLVAACPICETPFKDFDVDEDAGMCICPKCSWFRENLAKSSYNRDNGKTSSSNKNDYEDRENFYKAALRFACKQVKTFHEKLENDLDEYFIGIGIGPGSEIRQKPLIKGKREGVGFQMMIKALTSLSRTKKKELIYRKIYSDYYEDVWLIMHNYWGFTPNDIMHLIPKLMEIYDVTQEVYNGMSLTERGGRDAALNTQFRLLAELLSCDYECNKTDFKIQTSRESLENHQRIWKKMCHQTRTKFLAII